MSDTLRPHGLYSLWNCLGQNTGVGNLSFLQGIFPTQGSNPGLLHCGQILYHLSHPFKMSWVGYIFIIKEITGFPDATVVKNLPANAGDTRVAGLNL